MVVTIVDNDKMHVHTKLCSDEALFTNLVKMTLTLYALLKTGSLKFALHVQRTLESEDARRRLSEVCKDVMIESVRSVLYGLGSIIHHMSLNGNKELARVEQLLKVESQGVTYHV